MTVSFIGEDNTDLPKVTDKLYHMSYDNVALSTPRLNGIQTHNICGDINPTTIRSRPLQIE